MLVSEEHSFSFENNYGDLLCHQRWLLWPIIISFSLYWPHYVAFFYQLHNFVFSGELVRELTDPKRRIKSLVLPDVCLDGDTVIIPRKEERVVLYYQLNYD